MQLVTLWKHKQRDQQSTQSRITELLKLGEHTELIAVADYIVQTYPDADSGPDRNAELSDLRRQIERGCEALNITPLLTIAQTKTGFVVRARRINKTRSQGNKWLRMALKLREHLNDPAVIAALYDTDVKLASIVHAARLVARHQAVPEVQTILSKRPVGRPRKQLAAAA